MQSPPVRTGTRGPKLAFVQACWTFAPALAGRLPAPDRLERMG